MLYSIMTKTIVKLCKSCNCVDISWCSKEFWHFLETSPVIFIQYFWDKTELFCRTREHPPSCFVAICLTFIKKAKKILTKTLCFVPCFCDNAFQNWNSKYFWFNNFFSSITSLLKIIILILLTTYHRIVFHKFIKRNKMCTSY